MELVIGAQQGISYMTDSAVQVNNQTYFFGEIFFLHISLSLQPTHMADFSHITSLQTVVGDPGQAGKAMLQLRVAGSSEFLTVTCPSLTVAANMADLVDGYCRMVNSATNSIWNRKGDCDTL